MKPVLIGAVLCAAVLCGLIGLFGFLRLRDTLDRLHCAAFVNTTVGILLTIAALLSDGLSDRALKMGLITVLALLGGAASSHVLGRAMVARGAVPDALAAAGLPSPSDPPQRDPTLG